MKKITYESSEKKYFLPPLHNYNFNKKEIIIILILNILLLIYSIYSLLLTFNIEENDNKFNELGTIDYKIYLKENDYYKTDYLDKNMNYIASLINHIDIDFNYEVISDIKVNYNYTYNIKKTLYILDSTTQNILYKNEEIYHESTPIRENKNNTYILENLDIDYDHYNNIVNNFKNEYLISTKSYILVEMNIQNNISNDLIEEITTNNILKIEIPLSEQTIDININNSKVENNLVLKNKSYINNYTKFIMYLILTIILIIIKYIIIKIYFFKTKKDIYNKTISEYLKKYNSIIVNAKQPNLDESKFKEIIRVQNIEELINVNTTTEKPIIFYEVIENSKSYFIIMSEEILYKLTITRAYLERK